MPPREKKQSPASNLRRKAEKLIGLRSSSATPRSLEEIERQSHELAVHQVELEIQNQELRETQQKLLAARDRYADLYDFAPVGYLTLNEYHLIVEANLTASKMLGVERNDLLRRRLTLFVSPASQDQFYQTFYRMARRSPEGERHAGEIRMVRPDGRAFWARLEGVRAGTTLRLAIIDITDMKEADDNLSRAKAELEAANKELKDIDFALTQDMKAGLRQIGGFSQIVLEDHGSQLNRQAVDYLERICSISDRMGRYVDGLLKLSEVTHAQIDYSQVSLSALAESIALKLAVHQPERHVSLAIQPGLTVNGDYHLLHLALEKLLENAFKFTASRRETRIEFGLTRQHGEPVYFVSDNGVGFDMHYADRLFIPFQSLHSETELHGDAVGLAIAQRVVHRHGGRIWAEGKARKGATFYFTLGQAVDSATD